MKRKETIVVWENEKGLICTTGCATRKQAYFLLRELKNDKSVRNPQIMP